MDVDLVEENGEVEVWWRLERCLTWRNQNVHDAGASKINANMFITRGISTVVARCLMPIFLELLLTHLKCQVWLGVMLATWQP